MPISSSDGNIYEDRTEFILAPYVNRMASGASEKPADAFKSEGGTPDTPSDNLLQKAQKEFPILKNMDIGYKESFGQGQGFMESWPVGEEGSSDRPRPKDLDVNKFGVEIFNPKSTTLDLAGDIVSHKLINDDPLIKDTYQGFISSLQPWQKDKLKGQYDYAKENFGESRSYEDWEKNTGIPAYFRGYAFKQWENADEMYTPEQRQSFDKMVGYLRGRANEVPIIPKNTNEPYLSISDTAQWEGKNPIIDFKKLETEMINRGYKTVEDFVKSVWDTATLPGDVYRGKVDLNSPEGQQRVFDMATNLAGGGITTAPMRETGLGIFGGRMTGEAVKQAERLESKGFPESTIKQVTGLERGADNKWRKEIDDSEARIRPSALSKVINQKDTRSAYLDQFLHHPELFNAYPEFRDLVVSEVPVIGNKDTVLGRAGTNEGVIWIKAGQDPNTLKDTLIHELQHFVQKYEGFSYGTPHMLSPYLRDQYKGHILRTQYEKDVRSVMDLVSKGEFGEARALAEGLLKDADYGVYKNLATEVEARNASNRINLTADERKQILGKKTEDTHRTQQIVQEPTQTYIGGVESRLPPEVTPFRKAANDNKQLEIPVDPKILEDIDKNWNAFVEKHGTFIPEVVEKTPKLTGEALKYQKALEKQKGSMTPQEKEYVEMYKEQRKPKLVKDESTAEAAIARMRRPVTPLERDSFSMEIALNIFRRTGSDTAVKQVLEETGWKLGEHGLKGVKGEIEFFDPLGNPVWLKK